MHRVVRAQSHNNLIVTISSDDDDDEENVKISSHNCCECEEQFDDPQSLESHIASIHVGWFPYECDFCPRFAATEVEIKRHCAERHPEEKAVFKCHPDDKKKARMKSILQRCSRPIRRRVEADDRLTNVSLAPGSFLLQQNEKTDSFPTSVLKNSSRIEFPRPPTTTQRALSSIYLGSNRNPIRNLSFPVDVKPTFSSASAASMRPPSTPQLTRPTSIISSTSSAASLAVPTPVATPLPTSYKLTLEKLLPSVDSSLPSPDSADNRREKKSATNPLTMTDCQLCHRAIVNDGIVTHVKTVHLPHNILLCVYCDFGTKHNLYKAMKKHQTKMHPGQPYKYTSAANRFKDEINNWLARCFPTARISQKRFKSKTG